MVFLLLFFFFNQKTAYEMRISDWSSDVCSSDLFSANLNFDFRVGDTTKLYARGIYSQFDDHEYRRETSFKLEDAGEITGNGTDFVFSDAVGELQAQISIKDRFEQIGSASCRERVFQ